MSDQPAYRTASQIADRVSWRDPEALVSGAVVVLFAVGYGFTYFVAPPEGSEQAVGQMQGALLGALGSVVTYWIGSSRSSRRSADRADKALDIAKTVTEEKK